MNWNYYLLPEAVLNCLKSRKDMITRLYYVRMMNIEADGALLC